jgi:KUP system potassium uptake protein
MSTGGIAAPASAGGRAGIAALTVGSVGVVYGDIGTSPIYAFREAVRRVSGDGLVREEVLGIASLLLWALLLIVTLKYVVLLLRADNRGEGGILALLALVQGRLGKRAPALLLLRTAGAALFYGDAMITPAISVLSAVEGLALVTPALGSFVLPLTAAILVGLFLVQGGGTGAISAWFGPVMVVWFAVLAASGAVWIAAEPSVLAAIDPSSRTMAWWPSWCSGRSSSP